MDINLAVMELGWRNPSGDDIPAFFSEVRSADFEGVSCFTKGLIPYLDRPAEYAQLLAAEDLSLASVDIETGADHDLVRRTCAFMAELGCEALVCLGGKGTAADTYVDLAPVLDAVGSISNEFGIRTHYHNGRTRETIADMETVYDHVDPSLVHQMCDTGHATRDFLEVDSPADRAPTFLSKHWDQIDFIEFKDWCEETELDTPVGEGLCGYDQIFDLFRTRGYSGWLLLEQNGNEDLQKDRTPVECAKSSREFVRSGLGV
jgi:sugar phosphate isomerase/epimerase